MTVPVFAVNVPPVPETTVPGAVKLIVPDPPSRVPAVRVQVPLNVCVNPLPRFSVPLVPLMVRPTPVTGPVNVATPAVFVIETGPVVVKPAILCVEAFPESVTPPDPLVNIPALAPVPLIVKSPPRVNGFEPVIRVARELIVNGIPGPNTFEAPMVMAPVPAIKTPPAPVNGVTHSNPVVSVAVLLY